LANLSKIFASIPYCPAYEEKYVSISGGAQTSGVAVGIGEEVGSGVGVGVGVGLGVGEAVGVAIGVVVGLGETVAMGVDAIATFSEGKP